MEINQKLIEKFCQIVRQVADCILEVYDTDFAAYYAAKSLGAFKSNAEGITESIKVKTSEINRITIAGSRSHGSEKQTGWVAQKFSPSAAL